MQPSTVLYPGSYVDIDKRTPRFFADVDGVAEIVERHRGPIPAEISFVHADYTTELDLPEDHFVC